MDGRQPGWSAPRNHRRNEPEIDFVNFRQGWLARPYDGGIDVWAPTEQAAQAFRERFRDWAPFAGAVDKFEVAGVAHPDERSAIRALVEADASVYLNESNRPYLLKICSSRTDDRMLAQIARLTELEYLHVFAWQKHVSPSPLTDEGLTLLAQLPRLKHLHLPARDGDFPRLTERGLHFLEPLRARLDAGR